MVKMHAVMVLALKAEYNNTLPSKLNKTTDNATKMAKLSVQYLVVPLFEQLLHLLLGQAPQRHVEDVVEVWS